MLNAEVNLEGSILPLLQHSVPGISIISGSFLDRFEDVGRLRQDGFLEVGVVGDRCIERRDPPDWRIEMREQVAGNSRGQLGAESAVN